MRVGIPVVFLIFLPFTSVFSLNEYFSLSVVITLLLGLYYILYRIAAPNLPLPNTNTNTNTNTMHVIFFLCAVIFLSLVVMISSVSSGGIVGEDRLGHVLARLSFIVLIFCIIFIGLASSKCSASELRSMILMSYLVVLVLCLFDFAQLYGFSDVILPRARVETLEATFGGEYFRVRGPAEEPGHLAAFFAATLPLLVQWSRRPYFILWVIAVPVFAFTFSAAFVIWLFAFVFLSITFSTFQSERKSNRLFLVAMKVVSILFLNVLGFIFIYYIADIPGKFYSTSFSERIESYSLLGYLLDTPSNLLFGLGPGAFKEFDMEQPINFLLSTLVELGIFGAMVIVIMFFYNLFYLMRGKYIFLAAGTISYLVFFNSIGNYWYPFFALPLLYVLFIPRIPRSMEHGERRRVASKPI